MEKECVYFFLSKPRHESFMLRIEKQEEDRSMGPCSGHSRHTSFWTALPDFNEREISYHLVQATATVMFLSSAINSNPDKVPIFGMNIVHQAGSGLFFSC